MSKYFWSAIFILLISSCGVNFFKPIEGKNPALEQDRLNREKGGDPDEVLKTAKQNLDANVQSVLTEIEDLIKAGTSYKDLDETVVQKLRTAIPQNVKEAFKAENLDDAGEQKIIEDYSNVMVAYSKTTTYSEINFLDVLLDSAGNGSSGGGSNLTLVGECPEGMDTFLRVAGALRKEHCSSEGLFGLENLELAALIGELLYTEKQEDGTYDYLELISDLKADGSEELIDLIESDNFSTYLQSMFFQIVYASCEFVTDDCGVDTSSVSGSGLRRIWESLQLSLTFEDSLKESGLLPDLSFSAKKIVDSITKDAKKIDGCSEFPGNPIFCTLLAYFRDAGLNCQSIETSPGACQAKE